MFTTLENTAITLDPFQLATSQGWFISDGIAFHQGCFPGYITLKNIEVVAGETYMLTFRDKYYTSGGVYPIVGGINGTNRTALGEYTEEFIVPEDATDLSIKFYSDGELGISYMNIYTLLDDPNNYKTLGFNAKNNRWTSYYTYSPEMMLKFVNDLFTFKQGRLWKHNKNETRNNFYGVQGTSKIKIIINSNPTEVKNFYTMRLKSNKAWSVIEITTPPRDGKSEGQLSRLKKGNFRSLQGDWFAKFLRDMNDPRFDTELEALMKGALLQGNYLELTLENTDTVSVKMLSADVEFTKQEFTY